MPRIFGLNAVGVLVSAIALYMVGFLFYGVLFQELWTNAMGLDPDAEAGGDPVAMAKGFVISLVTAIFLGMVYKKMNANDMMTAIKKSVFVWLGFAVTTLAYTWVYAGGPFILFLLDSAHLLTGFVVVAIVQTLMDGIGAKTATD
jgi:hypothetical protein